MIILILLLLILLLVPSLYSNYTVGGYESPFIRQSPVGKYKAAIVQYYPVVGRIEDNIRTVDKMLADIAPVDLIMLPECGITGYELTGDIQPLIGQTEQYCAELAKQRNSYVVCGLPTVQHGKIYDSLGVWNRTGEPVIIYNKWNLWPVDRAWGATAGSGPQYIDIEFGRCALAVCNDMNTADWADIYKPECKRLANYVLDNNIDYILFSAAIPRSKNKSPTKQIEHWAMRLEPLIGKPVKLLACSMAGDKYQGQSAIMDFSNSTYDVANQMPTVLTCNF